jgi:hypothetical protein
MTTELSDVANDTESVYRAFVRARREMEAATAAAKETEGATEALSVAFEVLAEQKLRAAQAKFNDTRKAIEELSTAQQRLEKDSAKAGDIFAKAGGEELPEKLRTIGDGFRIAGDESMSFGDRAKAGVGATVLAFGAVAGVVGQVVGSIASLARVGQEMGIAFEETARQAATLGTAIDAVAITTRGAIGASEAFAARNALASHAIVVQGNDLAVATNAMRTYAAVHGGTTTQAMENFAEAIRTNNVAALREFGVQATLTGSSTDRMRQAMVELSRAPTLPPSSAETVEANDRALTSLGQSIFHALDLYSEWHDKVAAERVQTESLTRAWADSQRVLGEFLQRQRDGQAILDGVTRSVAQQVAQYEQLQRAAANAAVADVKSREDAGIKTRGRETSNYRRAGGGGGGASHHESKADAELREQKDLLSARVAFEDEMAEMIADKARALSRTENEIELARQAKRDEAAGRDKQRIEERMELERRAQFEHNSAQARAQELDRQRHDMGTQFAGATKSALQLEVTTAQGAAGAFGSVMGSMTSSFKSHMAAVIQGRETIAQAFEGLINDVLMSLATESAVQAIYETAKGIADLASYNYVGAGQHFAAAGLYAVIAAGSGAAVFAMNKASAGGGAAAAAGSAAPPASARAGGGATPKGDGNVTYVINVNGSLVDREGFANAVGGAMTDLRERNRLPRAA